MPDTLVLGLLDVDTYSGAYDKSCTKFVNHDMTSFELSLNSDVLNNYPIELKGHDCIEFYRRFLENTRRLDNPYCSTVMTKRQFENSNFLITHNFDNEAGEDGQLTVKIKFASPLQKKLVLLYMPISEKRLHFDQYFNVVKQ